MVRKLPIGLTPDDLTARRGFIGGSDANQIAGGVLSNLHRLWGEKTGRLRPSDLSDVLAVMMGSWTEELNRYWFERQTGLTITREGERVIHPRYPYLAATLDGFTSTRSGDGCVYEAKHVNAFNYDAATILARYMPQLHHQMYVVGVEHAALSVFVGTMQWELMWVDFDPLYHSELLAAEQRFWRSVVEDKEPSEEGVTPPDYVPPVEVIDMTGNNFWASVALDWIESKEAALRNKQAGESLKSLLPETAASASGHGVAVKRDSRGYVRLSLTK